MSIESINNFLNKSGFKNMLFLSEGTAAREIVSDVTISIEILQKIYAAEMNSWFHYVTIGRLIRNPAIAAEMNDHATDELRHANLVAKRLLELGQNPLDTLSAVSAYSPICPITTVNNLDNCRYMMRDALNGESCAIKAYNFFIRKLRDNEDMVSVQIVKQILVDEVHHEDELEHILTKGDSND